jgi:hypothetical protein
MVMDWHDAALALAGIIGSIVALVHGVLTQRLMVAPFHELAGTRLSATIRRIVPALLQFSTFNWFVSGLVLIAAACWLGREAKLAVAVLVASSYLFGAAGNLWATRGRHPGWALYTAALVLIAYGVAGPGVW